MQQILPTGHAVTVIHFTYDIGGGDYRIACTPNMKEFGQTLYHPNYLRTGDPRAVTCPACKRVDLFIASARAHDAIR